MPRSSKNKSDFRIYYAFDLTGNARFVTAPSHGSVKRVVEPPLFSGNTLLIATQGAKTGGFRTDLYAFVRILPNTESVCLDCSQTSENIGLVTGPPHDLDSHGTSSGRSCPFQPLYFAGHAVLEPIEPIHTLQTFQTLLGGYRDVVAIPSSSALHVAILSVGIFPNLNVPVLDDPDIPLSRDCKVSGSMMGGSRAIAEKLECF